MLLPCGGDKIWEKQSNVVVFLLLRSLVLLADVSLFLWPWLWLLSKCFEQLRSQFNWNQTLCLCFPWATLAVGLIPDLNTYLGQYRPVWTGHVWFTREFDSVRGSNLLMVDGLLCIWRSATTAGLWLREITWDTAWKVWNWNVTKIAKLGSFAKSCNSTARKLQKNVWKN